MTNDSIMVAPKYKKEPCFVVSGCDITVPYSF